MKVEHSNPAVVDMVRRAREAELSFAASLSDEERTAAGTPESWSATYTLAHITAAKRRFTHALGAARSGGVPSLAHDEAEVYAENQGRAWADVEDEASAVFDAFLGEVERLTEDELVEVRSQPWLEGRSLAAQIVGYGVWHPYGHLTGYYRQRDDDERVACIERGLIDAVDHLQRLPALRQDAVSMYNMACICAAAGRNEQALELLAESLRLDPELSENARTDPDLEPLRTHPDFQAVATA